MGCARATPAAPVQRVEPPEKVPAVQPPSAPPEVLQVSQSEYPQLRQTAEVSSSPTPPSLPGDAVGEAASLDGSCSLVRIGDSSGESVKSAIGKDAPKVGTADSLYAQALRELQRGALAAEVATEEDLNAVPTERLLSTMSCVRGSLGVTKIHFAEDDAMLLTMTNFKEQCSPGATKGSRFTWVRGEVLGCGSLGSVFCALEQAKGQVIAVKEVLINQEDETDMRFKEALEHEISIIQELKHPHIVSYLGHDYVNSCLYIYLEYMPGGSLAQVLAQFGPFEESLIAVYTRELLEGLEYLHTRRPAVLHRDVKGGNVLVGLDCKVKLSDFGCSKRHADSTLARTFKGSIPWMAPEVILHTGYGTAADVWSLGCVVVEMATGKQPWAGKFDNPMTACYRIGMSDDTPPVPASLSPTCQDFAESCLRREPLVRLSASELLLHKFVEHLVDDSIERRDVQTYLDTVPDDPELLEFVD